MRNQKQVDPESRLLPEEIAEQTVRELLGTIRSGISRMELKDNASETTQRSQLEH